VLPSPKVQLNNVTLTPAGMPETLAVKLLAVPVVTGATPSATCGDDGVVPTIASVADTAPTDALIVTFPTLVTTE